LMTWAKDPGTTFSPTPDRFDADAVNLERKKGRSCRRLGRMSTRRLGGAKPSRRSCGCRDTRQEFTDRSRADARARHRVGCGQTGERAGGLQACARTRRQGRHSLSLPLPMGNAELRK
jgi:hypothetical protein